MFPKEVDDSKVAFDRAFHAELVTATSTTTNTATSSSTSRTHSTTSGTSTATSSSSSSTSSSSTNSRSSTMTSTTGTETSSSSRTETLSSSSSSSSTRTASSSTTRTLTLSLSSTSSTSSSSRSSTTSTGSITSITSSTGSSSITSSSRTSASTSSLTSSSTSASRTRASSATEVSRTSTTITEACCQFRYSFLLRKCQPFSILVVRFKLNLVDLSTSRVTWFWGCGSGGLKLKTLHMWPSNVAISSCPEFVGKAYLTEKLRVNDGARWFPPIFLITQQPKPLKLIVRTCSHGSVGFSVLEMERMEKVLLQGMTNPFFATMKCPHHIPYLQGRAILQSFGPFRTTWKKTWKTHSSAHRPSWGHDIGSGKLAGSRAGGTGASYGSATKHLGTIVAGSMLQFATCHFWPSRLNWKGCCRCKGSQFVSHVLVLESKSLTLTTVYESSSQFQSASETSILKRWGLARKHYFLFRAIQGMSTSD